MWSGCDHNLWSFWDKALVWDCEQNKIRLWSGDDQLLSGDELLWCFDQAMSRGTVIRLWSDCYQTMIRLWSGFNQRLRGCDPRLWSGCDQIHFYLLLYLNTFTHSTAVRNTSMPSMLPWSQVMILLYYWVVKTHFCIWWLCGCFVTKNFIIVCCGVWTHDQKHVPLGIWTHDHLKISFPWTLMPLNSVKCQNEKKAAPPEKAGVPLPTCSGGKAIHDPQQRFIVLFLHPVPYAKYRKIKLYKLIFKNCKNFQKTHLYTKPRRTFLLLLLWYNNFHVFEKYRWQVFLGNIFRLWS